MTEPLAPPGGVPAPPPAAGRAPRWGIPDAAIGFFLGLLGATLGVAVTGGASDPDTLTLPVVVGSLLGLWAGYVGTCVVVSRLKGLGSLADDFGLRIAWLRDLVVGVVAGVASSWVLVWLVYEVLQGLRVVDEDAIDQLGDPARELADLAHGGRAVLLLLLIGVGAPVVEELFYRGLLQRALVRRLGRVAGVGVGALVFAAAHRQPLQFPALLAFGVVLGVLAHRTRRLGPAIVAHVTFNSLTMVLLLLDR